MAREQRPATRDEALGPALAHGDWLQCHPHYPEDHAAEAAAWLDRAARREA